jgi:hypothetical protein
MPRILIRPETHERMTEQIARTLEQRDRDELGRKPTQVERIQMAASARVEASRLTDRLIANVLAIVTPLVGSDAVAL